MKITPLGAGQEVGRSCILMEYKSKVVMVRHHLKTILAKCLPFQLTQWNLISLTVVFIQPTAA
jgi:predicted metal-dependent RNase